MSHKIVVTAGGTGGHMMPASAMVEELIDHGFSVSIISDVRGYNYPISWNKKVILKKINGLGLQSSSLLAFIKALIFTSLGFLQSFAILVKNRPNCVLSFGGYISVPVVLAAFCLRIPIIIHEQNALMGKANRICSIFADKILLSFVNTTKIPKRAKGTIRIVGLPVRKEFFSDKQDKRRNDKYMFYFVGGSQGSQIISHLIPKAFQKLSDPQQKSIIVYHQCRSELIENIKVQWQKTQVDVHLKSFFHDVPYIMSNSHCIITRAGASTIFEIATISQAQVYYIPFAHAANDHQDVNAKEAKRIFGANIVLENEFTLNVLQQILVKILKESPENLKQEFFHSRQAELKDIYFKFMNVINQVIRR